MKITNARIVLRDRVIDKGTIEIENERIKDIREGIEKDSDIDAGGKYLAQGCGRGRPQSLPAHRGWRGHRRHLR